MTWKLRKKEKVGVVFHREVEVTVSEDKKGKYIYPLLEIIIIFLTAYIVAWCFLTGVTIQTRLNILVVGAITVLQYVQYHFRRKLKYTLPIGVLLYFFCGLIFYKEITQGFYIVANQYIKLFGNYYNLSLVEFLIRGEWNGHSIEIFLYFILVPLIGLVTIGITYSKRILYILTTAPIVFAPVVVGVLPGSFYFVGYVVLLISVMGGLTTGRQRESGLVRMRTSLVLLVIVPCLFLAVFGVFSPNTYTEKVDVREKKIEIQTAFEEITSKGFWEKTFLNEWYGSWGNTATGGLSGGELGEVDEVVFTKETVLRIKMVETFDERIYLRGFVGSNYKGNQWVPLERGIKKRYNDLEKEFVDKGVVMENLSRWHTEDLDLFTRFMEIEKVKEEDKAHYVPYSTKSKMSINKQGFIRLEDIGEENPYEIDYFPFSSEIYASMLEEEEIGSILLMDIMGESSEKFKILEEKYREFVYEAYLNIPTYCEAGSIFGGMKEGDKYSLSNAITTVKTYLKENSTYSLSPGKLPAGEDFVDYFLFQNKKGYCAHYASAATILFRSMGIPARYVEGFVINQLDGNLAEEEDNGRRVMNIEDTNAHAWVEIYVDGFGWIPVETTSGYTDGSQLPDEILEQRKTNLNNEKKNQFMPTPDMGMVTPTPTVAPSIPTVNTPTAETNGEISNEMNSLIKFVIFVLGIILTFIITIVLRRKIILFQYKKRWERSSNKEKVLILYKRINRVLNYYGISYEGEKRIEYVKNVEKTFSFVEKESFAKFFELVLKAKFSSGTISEEEWETAAQFYSDFHHGIYSSGSKIQRIYFKHVILL